MKVLIKLFVLIVLLFGNSAFAEKLLVLPTELYSNNYYSFPEVSQIMAEDIINDFNKSNKISAISLYDVRKKLAENPSLKTSATYVLDRYKNSNAVDFVALKKLAQAFDVNSVLLVSSMVVQDSNKRNIWEVLEISSVFNAISTYNMETTVLLTDNINDIVMWSGKFNRKLGDNESRFWAKSSSQAVSQLEKIKTYSKDIISKNVVQNVTRRFYTKTITPKEQKNIEKTNVTDFRVNPFGTNRQTFPETDEIESDSLFSI